LLEIASRSGLSFAVIARAAERLERAELLDRKAGVLATVR
jgi:aminopeptidase-like protein